MRVVNHSPFYSWDKLWVEKNCFLYESNFFDIGETLRHRVVRTDRSNQNTYVSYALGLSCCRNDIHVYFLILQCNFHGFTVWDAVFGGKSRGLGSSPVTVVFETWKIIHVTPHCLSRIRLFKPLISSLNHNRSVHDAVQSIPSNTSH